MTSWSDLKSAFVDVSTFFSFHCSRVWNGTQTEPEGLWLRTVFIFCFFFTHISVPPVGNSSSQSAHFGSEIVHLIAHLLIKFICCLDNEKGHKNRFKRINFYIPKHKIVSCVNLNRQFFVIFSLPDSQDVIEEDLRGVPWNFILVFDKNRKNASFFVILGKRSRRIMISITCCRFLETQSMRIRRRAPRCRKEFFLESRFSIREGNKDQSAIAKQGDEGSKYFSG